jgi:general secretion pathway protein J
VINLRARADGFTLIEVLVSLALMAMIAMILIASLEVGGHTWQRVTRESSNSDEIAQTQRFLRERLSSLYPYERTGTEVSQSRLLLSDGASLEFSAPAPESMRNGLLRYRIEVDADALMVRAHVDRGGASLSSSPNGNTELLLASVVGMTVQFLVKGDAGSAHWVDRWVDSSHLPLLIRIDVRFADKDPRRWPSLYVEPRVDTAVTCAFDVVSRSCRRAT